MVRDAIEAASGLTIAPIVATSSEELSVVRI